MGVAANPPGVAVQRAASMTEDPANRRLNGGGTQRWIAHLIPMSAPQIVITPGGPAVTHSSDFSLVTASKPAAAGEILSLFASGLGPVNPGVDPGQPFPSSPLAIVNSPVEVTVNGKSAEVLGAVGFPGAVDGYQVNFRSASGYRKGSGHDSVERGLDFRNCGGDRGSVNVGRTGAERSSYPGCDSLRTLDTTRRSDAECRRRHFSEHHRSSTA